VPRKHRNTAGPILFLLLTVAGQQAAAQGSVPTGIELEPIVLGLTNPVGIVSAEDASGRLFLVEQGGRIRIFDGSALLTTPFLDISALILSGGERGLLGLAVHPNYAVNGFFYVNYTDTNGDTVIARYQVSPDPNVADPSSASILLSVAQPFPNHNGGDLHFGPDGFLYIALGDGGSAGDPDNRAQNLGELLGKILRIDVDSAVPYFVPPTNPFVGVAGARPEIWAWGLRNSWRFSFDRETSDLFIADVGQASREEVNFQSSTSPGGENYGWRRMEGTACFNPSTNCNDGTLVLPILEYTHVGSNCSITGGYRYRGTDFPQLAGLYFFGDFCSGRLWGAQESDGIWTSTELLDTTLLISAFGEDEDGELYVADYAQGIVYRLTVPINANFRGRVRDANDVPVAGATVEALFNGMALYSTVTNGRGRYALEVAAGTYELVVSQTGFLVSTRAGLSIDSDQTVKRIRFRLFRPSFFQGMVRDRTTGTPVAGALVETVRNGVVQFSTTTAPDGTYSLQVRKRTYDLRASAPGYRTKRKRDRRIGDGQVRTGVNFVLRPQ